MILLRCASNFRITAQGLGHIETEEDHIVSIAGLDELTNSECKRKKHLILFDTIYDMFL